MSYQVLEVKPLTLRIGAEIGGVEKPMRRSTPQGQALASLRWSR
jgi:hypothetical protein